MHLYVYKCIGIYIGFLFNLHFRKLLTDFYITSVLYFEKLELSSGFIAFYLQLKIKKSYYNSYFLLETSPETIFQFTFYSIYFYSYYLSHFKMSYPF